MMKILRKILYKILLRIKENIHYLFFFTKLKIRRVAYQRNIVNKGWHLKGKKEEETLSQSFLLSFNMWILLMTCYEVILYRTLVVLNIITNKIKCGALYISV